jgi:orotate phosphoribosyltransferase
MYKEVWKTLFEEQGVLWQHDGNPSRPHPILASGLHTDGYFNARKLSSARVLDNMAYRLTNDLRKMFESIQGITHVVGPAYGGIALAAYVARHISMDRLYGNSQCKFGFVEKVGESMDFLTMPIDAGGCVLIVDDVYTTGKSVRQTFDAVRRSGCTVFPAILTLVNRSSPHVDEFAVGIPIISLHAREMPTWHPNVCPLCAAGSEAVETPKSAAEWDKLTRWHEHE